VSSEGTLDKGVGQTVDPGLAAYVELTDDARRFFVPSIRIGVEFPLDQSPTTAGGFDCCGTTNTYRRIVGRLDACPLRSVASRSWSSDAFTAAVCARLDVGRLRAEGPVVEVDRPWVAPGALLRVRWTSPRFFVELEAGVAFPLVRESFASGSANEVPAAAEVGGLGFGVFFL
jgi:hypothetical protein